LWALKLSITTIWPLSSTLSAENTSTFDVDTLHAQLLGVRTEGWVASNGERSPGVAAVAALVFDARGGVIGGLLVSVPSVRLPAKRVRELASLVVEAASRTSADLGTTGEVPPTSKGKV
jgi:DNA-binding IclR family transcriptional regulator